MGTEPEQDPHYNCQLTERVLRASNKSEYWGYKPHIPEVWKYSEDNVAAGKNVNVAFAAHISTHARLKLYEYLSNLEQSVLYYDTDLVIFVQRESDSQK